MSKKTQLTSETGAVNPGTSPEGLKRTQVANGWVPQGEYVEVAGRIIPGMVYICNSNEIEVRENDYSGSTSCIDLAKPVSGSDKLGNLLTTKKYAEMAPECRASYLDWLASGRKDRSYCPEYHMLYFYGLERRLMLDASADAKQVKEEMDRLSDVFKFNDNLTSTLENINTFLGLVLYPLKYQFRYPNTYAALPLDFHLEISDLLYEGRNLNGDQLFRWFKFDYVPRKYKLFKLSDLKDDFLKKFKEFHPNGISLDRPDKEFTITYASPTNDFRSTTKIVLNGRPLLDIYHFDLVKDKAKAILDEIVKDRPKPQIKSPPYSEDVELPPGVKIEDLGEPIEIDAEGFTNWAAPLAGTNTSAKFGEILDRLDTIPRTDTNELDFGALTNFMRAMGFGFAPHMLLYLREPTRDTPVYLYKTDFNHHQAKAFTTFEQVIICLGIGAHLYSFGKLSSREASAAFRDFATSCANLDESDMAGIHANINYLLSNLPDVTFISRVLESDPKGKMEVIRSIAVEMAKFLNAGKSKKLSMLEAFYEFLELDPKLAQIDMQTGGPRPNTGTHTSSEWHTKLRD